MNSPCYILEDSNFDFRYVRLCDLDIPRENWLNYWQTVETLIRCRILQHLIWVCTVCQVPFWGFFRLQWVKGTSIDPDPKKDVHVCSSSWLVVPTLLGLFLPFIRPPFTRTNYVTGSLELKILHVIFFYLFLYILRFMSNMSLIQGQMQDYLIGGSNFWEEKNSISI